MPTYEMLWDCSSCGTNKLLGKSHRRCPHCGAPQDPTKRYFPPAGEEVPVEGHVYVGVDWRCAACETPNSKAADFCVNCGNPREGNAAVKLVDDQPAARPGPPAAARLAPTSTSGSKKGWLVLASVLGAVLLLALVVAIFWTRDTAVTIAGHAWQRDIDVEQMAARADSAWCSSMPGDAYSVRRSREVRSHRDVPDGQECHTVRRDNGDGTYSTSQECSTKYRSEPVYDDKCYFTINRWGVSRTERAQGVGVSPAPTWPPVRLSRTGSCLGCEREGARREVLTVKVHGPKRDWDCEVDAARWQRLADGVAAKVKVRVVTGGAVCSSLR
ncbi:MAG: zinc ribbon domain-containing protein [Deltaproteobacteria bacterium]|nr:zinc ribbon domain-containing protein [Deltaproteobacteria bacterium]